MPVNAEWTQLKLTETQRWLIINALRVHADQCATDAATFDVANNPRIGEAYRRDRDTLRALADAIESADVVTIGE